MFVQYYEPFIEPGLLEILDRIEKYTEEKQSRILNTTILDENRVTYQITDQNYMLPDMSGINTAMIEQMNEIRNNNYILPRKLRASIIFMTTQLTPSILQE